MNQYGEQLTQVQSKLATLSDQVTADSKVKEQLTKVQAELATLSDQVKADSKVLPLSTAGLSWVGDPIRIGFIRSTSGTQTFPLPEALPSTARMVRIVAFHKSGNEGPGREVLYRLWTEARGEHHVHNFFGYRYPQSAISFRSPEFWFPVDPSAWVLKASTESRQPSNDHGVQLYVSGYKL